MDNRITQELPGNRTVSVVPLPDDRFGIDLVCMNGSARIKTSLGLSREAAEALVLLLALHGVTAPKPARMEVRTPQLQNLPKSWLKGKIPVVRNGEKLAALIKKKVRK